MRGNPSHRRRGLDGGSNGGSTATTRASTAKTRARHGGSTSARLRHDVTGGRPEALTPDLDGGLHMSPTSNLPTGCLLATHWLHPPSSHNRLTHRLPTGYSTAVPRA